MNKLIGKPFTEEQEFVELEEHCMLDVIYESRYLALNRLARITIEEYYRATMDRFYRIKKGYGMIEYEGCTPTKMKLIP